MKKEFNIKDKVWIHIGSPKLIQGRIVEIIDLAHLNEEHDPNRELYVVECKTAIEDVYEIRTWEQISPDAKGPINLFRIHQGGEELLAFKRIGVVIPTEGNVIPSDEINEPVQLDLFEPDTVVETEEATDTIQTTHPNKKFKRHYYKKKKPNKS